MKTHSLNETGIFRRVSQLLLFMTVAPRAAKMTQIARCDWLPERLRWSHLACSGLPAVSRKKNPLESHIINPLLTKFARSRWLNIGVLLFLRVYDLDFVSVHKHAKKELGHYPAILTSHLVNNPYVFFFFILSFLQLYYILFFFSLFFSLFFLQPI